MDIQAIKIVIKETAEQGCKALKQAAIWGGRKIQIGFTNYLVPAIKALWIWSANTLSLLKEAVNTGPGSLFAFSGVLFIAGVTAFKIADCKAIEESAIAMASWKALGIIAFVGATIAAGFALAAV